MSSEEIALLGNVQAVRIDPPQFNEEAIRHRITDPVAQDVLRGSVDVLPEGIGCFDVLRLYNECSLIQKRIRQR